MHSNAWQILNNNNNNNNKNNNKKKKMKKVLDGVFGFLRGKLEEADPEAD